EDGIRDLIVTGVQTCALPISLQSFTDSTGQLHPRYIPIRIDHFLYPRDNPVVDLLSADFHGPKFTKSFLPCPAKNEGHKKPAGRGIPGSFYDPLPSENESEAEANGVFVPNAANTSR